MSTASKSTITFIDASNIIYGTRDEGWKVDFAKLFKYLSERFKSQTIYYFGGQDKDNSKQLKFYKLLEKFGYKLIIKPVKIYKQGETTVRKANCDVDLTFYAMRDFSKYDEAIFLTGDGDFEILFKYLIEKHKRIRVIANGKRTAHEIKKLLGGKFTELGSLRQIISYKKKKR